MIDTTSVRGRAAAAAMRLAEKKPWREVSLLDIADEAGLTLVDLSKELRTKTAVLRAFARLVDEAVLRKAERREAEESARDRLFDVLMTRFEAMAPYRAGLRRIAGDLALAPELAGSLLTSQAWMLAAAGIPADGVTGAVRTAGLASVYAATFRDWLDDDDAGLARTMAGLDRRLRRGEGFVRTLDRAGEAGHGVFTWLRRGRGRRGAKGGDGGTAATGGGQPGSGQQGDAVPPGSGPTGPTSSLH